MFSRNILSFSTAFLFFSSFDELKEAYIRLFVLTQGQEPAGQEEA